MQLRFRFYYAGTSRKPGAAKRMRITTMKETIRKRVEDHGINLLKIFPNAKIADPVQLCRKLRQLELRASRFTVALCNGTTSQDAGDKGLEKIETEVNDLLGNTDVPVFINRDPRGYALKIDDEWMLTTETNIERDWGGYGILAPDLN